VEGGAGPAGSIDLKLRSAQSSARNDEYGAGINDAPTLPPIDVDALYGIGVHKPTGSALHTIANAFTRSARVCAARLPPASNDAEGGRGAGKAGALRARFNGSAKIERNASAARGSSPFRRNYRDARWAIGWNAGRRGDRRLTAEGASRARQSEALRDGPSVPRAPHRADQRQRPRQRMGGKQAPAARSGESDVKDGHQRHVKEGARDRCGRNRCRARAFAPGV